MGAPNGCGYWYSYPAFWLTTLTLLVALPAGACALAVCRWPAIGGAAATAAVVLAAGYAIRAGNDAGRISDTAMVYAMLLAPVAGMLLLASDRIHRVWHQSVALFWVGLLAVAAGLGFPGFDPDQFPAGNEVLIC